MPCFLFCLIFFYKLHIFFKILVYKSENYIHEIISDLISILLDMKFDFKILCNISVFLSVNHFIKDIISTSLTSNQIYLFIYSYMYIYLSFICLSIYLVVWERNKDWMYWFPEDKNRRRPKNKNNFYPKVRNYLLNKFWHSTNDNVCIQR